MVLSMFGTLMTLIGASVWTALVKRTQSINSYQVRSFSLIFPLPPFYTWNLTNHL